MVVSIVTLAGIMTVLVAPGLIAQHVEARKARRRAAATEA